MKQRQCSSRIFVLPIWEMPRDDFARDWRQRSLCVVRYFVICQFLIYVINIFANCSSRRGDVHKAPYRMPTRPSLWNILSCLRIIPVQTIEALLGLRSNYLLRQSQSHQ